MSNPSPPTDPPQAEEPSSTAPPPAPIEEEQQQQSQSQDQEPEPGIRARAFREVLKRALNQTLKGCTPENIAQCFPTAAKARPAVMKDVHKQLMTQYEKHGSIGFEEILKAHNTVQKLNELDDLIEDAKSRKAAAAAEGTTEDPIPPSTLPPTDILDAHLTPHLLSAQTLLVDKLTTVQSENEQLMDTIEQQEAEIRALVAQLEKVVGGVEGAVKVVQECVGEGRGKIGGGGVGDGGAGGRAGVGDGDVDMVDA